MVIREQKNHLLLVTQPAHAWLSGQIAEHWGGNGYARPEPWREMCLAAARHDDGWTRRDMRPVRNPATGAPYDFRNMPIGEHMDIWDRSVTLVAESSRYAALLVSRHVMNLFSMHDFSGEPDDIRSKAKQFQEKQEELQRILIASCKRDEFYSSFLTDDTLEQHRRLLSAFDYLSLYVILGNAEKSALSDVPSGRSGSGRIQLEIKEEDAGNAAGSGTNGLQQTCAVSPWPFLTDRLSLRCDAIRIKRFCADQEELDRAMERAERVLFTVELVPE